MTGKRTTKTPQSESGQSKKSGPLLASCLLRAISDVGMSQEGAARVIGVAKRTIGRWVRAEVAMDVAAVLDAPRIGHRFRVHLCVHDHGNDSVPYILKKPRGRK